MNAAMFDEKVFPVVVVLCVLIGVVYIFLKEWLNGLDELTAFKEYSGEVEAMVNTEPEEVIQPVKPVNKSSFAKYAEEVMYIVNDGVIL